MRTHADATFKVDAWDEKPWDIADGQPKMTRAEVTKSFDGDLQGTSKLQYLMLYRPDGSADFVGLERVHGRLGGREGTFVLRHEGVFDDGAASGTWTVVAGSGTGALEGISGESEFDLPKGGDSFPFGLDYDLRQVARVS
jgi:hypothetical protein